MDRLRFCRIPKNSLLFEQGDTSNKSFYMIASGEVEVWVKDSKKGDLNKQKDRSKSPPKSPIEHPKNLESPAQLNQNSKILVIPPTGVLENIPEESAIEISESRNSLDRTINSNEVKRNSFLNQIGSMLLGKMLPSIPNHKEANPITGESQSLIGASGSINSLQGLLEEDVKSIKSAKTYANILEESNNKSGGENATSVNKEHRLLVFQKTKKSTDASQVTSHNENKTLKSKAEHHEPRREIESAQETGANLGDSPKTQFLKPQKKSILMPKSITKIVDLSLNLARTK
jgi:hypothetical protein